MKVYVLGAALLATAALMTATGARAQTGSDADGDATERSDAEAAGADGGEDEEAPSEKDVKEIVAEIMREKEKKEEESVAAPVPKEPPRDIHDLPVEPGHEPLDSDDISDWDHFEFSMGFVGGQRHYDRANFDWVSGGDGVAGSRELIEPFLNAPFDELYVAGLRYDVRLVVSYVRMTVGVDLPFSIYSTQRSVGNYEAGGQMHRVTVQEIQPIDLRFGIGGEYPIGPVAPFLDVMGGVHWVNAELNIDGVDTDYQATGFALSARAGMRLHVRKWFFASIAGEAGLVGDVRWGAELAVGFAAM